MRCLKAIFFLFLLLVSISSVAATDVPILSLVARKTPPSPSIEVFTVTRDSAGTSSVSSSASVIPAEVISRNATPESPAPEEPAVDRQPVVEQSTVTLRSEHGGNEARLILVWNEAVNFSKRLKGRELVMVFEKPFVPNGLDESIQGLFAWLGDVRHGYDALLLRASQAGTGFHVTAQGNEIIITMTLPPPTPELLEQRRIEDARLRFLKAKTMVSTRTMYGARMRLRDLVEEEPKNVEFLGELGTLEDQLGRWRQAVALYDRGLTQATGEPNLIFAKALLHHNHGPFFQTSGARKSSTKDNEQQDINELELFLVGSKNLDYDLKLHWVDLEIDNVTDADGLTANQVVEWLSVVAEMSMTWPDADVTRWGLLGGGDQWGLTLAQEFFHPMAHTRLRADWRRPFGGTTNGLVDNGWRDRLEVERDDTWHGSRLRTSLTGAVNRYGLEGEDRAAESVSILGSLRHAFLSRNNLELSYNLDKEMVHHQEQRINATGVTYTLFPITDKETHLLSAAWFDLWTDYLSYNSIVGYSYDRLTEQYGPSMAISLIYEPMADLKSALSLQRAYSRQAGDWVTTDQVDYSLKFLF
ncbi:MAG: hypothetical protein HQL83_05795 [Magnetococcales bacterium]|nr:hypothetical protein [Magnetococcales bacterium]